MIRASIYLETDVLDALREAAISSPKRLRTELRKIAFRSDAAKRLIGALSVEPGKPNYPIRWKSQKQRRYVMAKLRREGNLPYQRTHALSQGWRLRFENVGSDESQGIFIIENTVPSARYVQGDDAQPFHVSRWPQAAPLIRQYSPQFQNLVIEAWYKVVAP